MKKGFAAGLVAVLAKTLAVPAVSGGIAQRHWNQAE